ncbi:hypothetical protein [Aquabacter spiritensis]|uniref:N-acetyltransferase domain-containing protein n=1 Tax=Aquabacter spiritensis TaxID=933073 RepID=A0A4R3M360_9HYPH|nr:hypothetical protein [Aquabacter spiritensis]TCT05595.1 hypothetical protein EDC64_104152 [Aquabacter spiritensis]
MNAVTVKSLRSGARVTDWIETPAIVHAEDPHFVRQLDLKERMRIARRFNPFFRFARAEMFVAYRGGRPVGRISAQINQLHRARHDPQSGHFGFFDCIDDVAVARALFDAARGWLAAQGATSISGPFSFSINEESGLQVDGFDTPAAMLMNQARPHTGALVEAAGLTPEMDTFAFRLRGGAEVPALDRLAAQVAASAALTIRPVRVDQFAREVRLVIDIFNDAWSENWGFVPFTDGEIDAMVQELKPFYAAEYGRFVEIEGEAVAFILAIPDVNGLIQPFRGRLLPLNWWRLLSGLKKKRFSAFRVPLMGIRRAHQNSPLAAGILALMVSEALKEARNYDLDWVEFSWVLETNRPMMALARMIAGPPVKRYRYYRGPI